jgi:predicted amidohydrolase YtcJ
LFPRFPGIDMHILHNARVYTQNASQPFASAMAIQNGYILAVGTDDEILAAANRHSLKTNLNGRAVLPGLVDAHFHLERYALNQSRVNCAAETRQVCLERVAHTAAKLPPGEWVLGHGWNQNEWDGGYGSAIELDQAAPDNPVYLTAQSLHAGWANSSALNQFGISVESPDPPSGVIQRNSNGQPTGILLEAACDLAEKNIPPPSLNTLSAAIERAQISLWKLGLTGIHEFDQQLCFSALQLLAQDNRLKLRILKSIPVDLLAEATALGLRTGFGSNMLRVGGIKLFVDGALGPQTAAMLAPYENSSNNTGMLLIDEEEILEYGIRAAHSGLSLAVHAIGDRANRETLNAFKKLRQFETQNDLPPLRHRIEHVQIIHPNDSARFAALQLIASVQPVHLISDMTTANRLWGRRCAGAYAYNTLNQNGTRMAFGSDAPVEPCNPFLGLQAAVTRRRPEGKPGPAGWFPDERLSLNTALQGFTTGAAYAAGWERTMGQLAPGFYADLIVTNRDPFSINSEELQSISPVGTMIDGVWVWQAQGVD